MEIHEIYKQLTGVDISEQRQLWDERGKGYYGEYLLFCELYKKLPGNCKILMNLEIPVSNSKTTEIDLLLIHETGLYVFEIKHYKGTIYGKDSDETWTQYFRTAQNNTFKNPIKQNKYHVSAISKMYPNFPVHSIIVFTSTDCNLKIMNTDPNTDICQIGNVFNVLAYRFQQAKRNISPTDMDIFFRQLCAYSHMQDSITINDTVAPFIDWLQPMIENLINAKKELDETKLIYENKNNELTQKSKNILLFNVIFAFICIILSLFAITGFNL